MNLTIYDKAKYHCEGNFPKELGVEHSYTHTGMYLTWLIEQGLISESFNEDFSDEISQIRKRFITPGRFFRIVGGSLVSDMLNSAGNSFSRSYFDIERGLYLRDYIGILSSKLPTIYHVIDCWENYYLIAPVIDMRYKEWSKHS